MPEKKKKLDLWNRKFINGLFIVCTAGCVMLDGYAGTHSGKRMSGQTGHSGDFGRDAQSPGAAQSPGDAQSSGAAQTDGGANLQVTEENIQIPGVTGEYDILFLTDTHVVIKDADDAEQVRQYREKRHRQFHNAKHVSASEQFEDWITYANEKEADAVFFGGDIIDYPSEGNLEFLEAQLERLKMPYLYTPGNHDWTFPWEYMTKKGEDTYLPLLEPYMSGDTVLHTWETEDLLVIAVDNSSGQVNAKALQEYEEMLNIDKPVILLVHVPFLTQSVLSKAKKAWDSSVVLGGGNYGGIYPDESSGKFMEFITAGDSPVELVLAGHVHFYDKDYIVGDKEVLQLVGDAGFHGSALWLHITG